MIRLPRLDKFRPDWPQFQAWWQLVCKAIEDAVSGQDDVINDQAAQLEALTEAQDRLKLGLSYPVPTMVLTGSDAGVDATITIASHVRIYGDADAVNVTGGSITGLAFSTAYAVYYDDVTLANTAPTFVATTDLKTGQANYQPGRHLVGTITTPANGAGNTSGGAPPPGSGYAAGASAYVLT